VAVVAGEGDGEVGAIGIGDHTAAAEALKTVQFRPQHRFPSVQHALNVKIIVALVMD
jgi:hypothetical protein